VTSMLSNQAMWRRKYWCCGCKPWFNQIC